jgi:transmembrane 9 superfamily protein 2/4
LPPRPRTRQLCQEDYNWWWRSFFTSGCSAIYLFLYSAYYFHTSLQITLFVSALLYFGWMFLISIAFFFMTGVVGYWAALYFNMRIYASIKVD